MSKIKEINDLEVFLKAAFCTDGESFFVKLLKVEDMTSIMFKLTDSERGEFFIALSKGSACQHVQQEE